MRRWIAIVGLTAAATGCSTMESTGGPCTYTGRDMKTAHAGMGIKSEEFDALVGDLVANLNKFKVPEREKNELLGALGPMKKDIVEKPLASADRMPSY